MRYKLKALERIIDIEVGGEVSSLTDKIKVCRLPKESIPTPEIEKRIKENLDKNFPEFKWLILLGKDIDILELELVENK